MGGYVNRTKIAQLYADAESLGGQTVTVAGWVKSLSLIPISLEWLPLKDSGKYVSSSSPAPPRPPRKSGEYAF